MDTTKLYVAWLAIFVISVPLAFNLIPPNAFIGFRTASTLADPEVWKRVNIFAGWAFLLASILGGLITYYRPDVAESWGGLLLVAIVLIPLAISFVYLKVFIRA